MSTAEAIAASAVSATEAACRACHPATTQSVVGDWLGWVGANVIVGALAPLVVIGVIHLAKKAGRSNANVQYFDAYRGGALGFIALGWIAGAVAEVIKAATGDGLKMWHLWMLLLLVVVALCAALAAGLGTIPLVTTAVSGPTTIGTTAPKPEDIFVLKWSIGVCLIALLVAAFVHYATG